MRFNKFKQAVYLLERDWNKVKVAYKERGGNPLKWIFLFLFGLLCAALSITWCPAPQPPRPAAALPAWLGR